MVKRTRDIAFLSAIVYFTQGALGISGVALPLFLRNLKWSVTEITAVTSLAALPWIFKIVYGLLSDTCPLFGYRRKSYLILFSLISAIGWLSLVISPSEKNWILASMMLTNLGFAATDVITDGLVVEHSSNFTSSIYQSIAWGARSFGAVVSGVTGGWLAAHWLPKNIFLLTMLLPLTVTFVAFWIREHKREEIPFQSPGSSFKQCFKMLWTPNLRAFVMILFLASVSASFGLPFFFFMKETLGFKETFLGLLTSVGWGGAALGSIIYAKFLRNVSPKVTLRWAILLNCANILSTFLILDHRSACLFVFLGGVLGCLTMLPIMSSAASLTHHSGVEGTLFAILMSIFNLGQIAFGFLGGRLFAIIGLYPLILGTGIIALLGLIFVEQLKLGQEMEGPLGK